MPHIAKVAAQGKGTWSPTIEPRAYVAGYGRHVAHSTGQASREDRASSVNFTKSQTETAGADLDTATAIKHRNRRRSDAA